MTTNIAIWLQQAVPGQAALVVHLGAAPGVWPAVPAAHQPRQLWLVQGDAEWAAELRAEVAGGLPAQVVEAVVAPQAGPAVWHRCNLPGVGGLLPPAALTNVYPRLRVVERLDVQATALADWLAGLPASGAGDGPRVLIIDQPGLEAALLRALTPEALAGFDWLLLRGAREGLYEGGERLGDALRAARALHMASVREDAQADPLWPLLLLRRDAAAAERDALRLERRVLQQALEAAQADAKAAARDRDAARDAERRLQAQLGDAQQAKARAEHEAAERTKQLERSEQARLAADKLATDRAAELKAAKEQLQRLPRLEAELADGAARQHILQEELLKAEGQIELIKELLLRESGA